MSGHWIINVARAEIAGRTILVAAVLDHETREIINIGAGTNPASALGGAFCGAVDRIGPPRIVDLDHSREMDVVAQEAAKLGAEVRRGQTRSPRWKAIWKREHARALSVALGSSAGSLPPLPLGDEAFRDRAVRVATILDGVSVSQAVAILNEAQGLIQGSSTFRADQLIREVRSHAPASDE